MPIDQIDKVTIAVSADADHPVRTAIKGTEDELNKLVEDINSKQFFLTPTPEPLLRLATFLRRVM